VSASADFSKLGDGSTVAGATITTMLNTAVASWGVACKGGYEEAGIKYTPVPVMDLLAAIIKLSDMNHRVNIATPAAPDIGSVTADTVFGDSAPPRLGGKW